MYIISVHFKPIHMYTDTISLHLKTKLSVYILSLRHKKWAFLINFKIMNIFKNQS